MFTAGILRIVDSIFDSTEELSNFEWIFRELRKSSKKFAVHCAVMQVGCNSTPSVRWRLPNSKRRCIRHNTTSSQRQGLLRQRRQHHQRLKPQPTNHRLYCRKEPSYSTSCRPRLPISKHWRQNRPLITLNSSLQYSLPRQSFVLNRNLKHSRISGITVSCRWPEQFSQLQSVLRRVKGCLVEPVLLCVLRGPDCLSRTGRSWCFWTAINHLQPKSANSETLNCHSALLIVLVE